MKPCPFCGSEDWCPSIHHVMEGTLVTVSCEQCDAEGPPVMVEGIGQEAAMKKSRDLWNKRPRAR